MLKTHNCGELNKTHIGSTVTLAGWIDRRRDHGGLTFIDLRDREGVTQVVFNPEVSKECHETASGIRNEFVVRVTGEVSQRPAGTENTKLPTGEIEVIVHETEILNASKTPPFYINEEVEVDESLRLKYRYLDIRRERMRNNLILRHKVTKIIRDFLSERGFIDIETPMLIKSTPEGARDYLVPSRVHPGEFYALPQSPQQLKQLLMVAGIEKYFQIARCFRDEDTRADRQPEFTQLDIEMSFIEEADILGLMEELLTLIIETVRPDISLTRPFPHIKYEEAVERFGTDRPDMRFGLELRDLSEIAASTDFGVFKSAVSGGGRVRGICAPGCGGYTRGQLEELNKLAQSLGAAGLLTISLGSEPGSLDSLTMEDVKSVAAKFMTLEQVREMAEITGANKGDLLLIIAGKPSMVDSVLDGLRQEMGKRLDLIDPNKFIICMVRDFPLLKKEEGSPRFDPMHNPFTSPRPEDMHLLDSEPEKARGRHYDIVCNGFEIAGGGIRIHKAAMQKRVFNLLGYSDAEVDELFGHLLEAFEYGAPPHGGIAWGYDRLIMLLAGEDTIREVIAFPKNQAAMDLTLDAPSPVAPEQLTDLHLKVLE